MIQVENLTKYYDGFCAVDHICLNISKGEVLGLLGPNGAGKTSTLRMLTGYMMPSEGSIQVKDYHLEKQLLAIKKLIGYLPESAPLYHNMLVYDYLDYIARIREIPPGKRLDRIKALIRQCGLDGIMHRTIGELSKGLRQRVGLAHAMMDDPEILVLDEPTSGLDPNQIAEIRDIIRQIGRKKTVILSTHILSEAEATCNRVVIIHKGRIVADDTTQGLKQTAGRKALLHLSLEGAAAEQVTAMLSAVNGVAEVKTVAEEGPVTSFQLICDANVDPRQSVYTKIKATDWALLDFHQETKTLEHIFRELTKEN